MTNIEIPSDFYYLVARGPALGSLATDRHCHPTGREGASETDFVLAGAEAGSKLEKAQSLGVEVIDEEQFMKMIGSSKRKGS